MSCSSNGRIIYIDILKIISILGVILIHVAATHWDNIYALTNRFEAMNFWNAIGRFAVPCFVMCSGILFLEKTKLTYKDMFKKYIPRVLIAFLVWNLIYAFVKANYNIQDTIAIMQKGISRPHLWFMIMILGLYLVTPIIRIFIQNAEKKDVEYFLVIAFIIQFIIPFLVEFETFEFIKGYYNNLYPAVVTGYIGYYVLGYYLNKYELNKKAKIFVAFMGIASIVFTILFNIFKVKSTEVTAAAFFEPLHPNILFYSMFIFIIVQKIFNKVKPNEKVNKAIVKTSSLVFGVYLIHQLYIDIFDHININSLMCNTYIAIPIVVLLVFICSLVTVYIISKIPFLRKIIL